MFSDNLELLSFVLSIIGITSNGTAIFATARTPNGRTTHTNIIISLCVSDSFVLIAISLKYILDTFTAVNQDCKNLYKLILYVALIASQLNLLAMALDHYIAITRPLQYRCHVTNSRGCFLIFGIWVFSISAALLDIIFAFAMKAGMSYSQSICTIILIDKYDLELFIIGFIFVVLFIIVIIYTRIYIQLKSSVQTAVRHTHNLKTLVTTIILIGSFTICWAPMGIYQTYMNILLRMDKPYMIQHLEDLLLVNKILLIVLQMNSLINPLIYAIRLPQVRSGYQTCFHLHRYRGNQEHSLELNTK